MKKEAYQKRMRYFNEHPDLSERLHIANKILTGIVFVSYPVLLFWLFREHSPALVRAVFVPLGSLAAVSVFRCAVNRKRPYEAFETKPAIPKATQGKSFPSRHVFCVFLIAMTYLCLTSWRAAGLFLLAAGVLLAVVRVLTGVHYVSDVCCGAAAGILAGLLGYVWL